MFYTNRVLKDYKEKYVSVCDVKQLVYTPAKWHIGHFPICLIVLFLEIRCMWNGSMPMCPFGLSCRPTSSSTTRLDWAGARLWVTFLCVRFVPHASINEFPKYLSILVLQGPVASASGGAPRGGAPAPPPPGPPPPPMDLGKSSGGDSGATNRNALFASINMGADITKGIKWIPNLM